MIVRAHTEDGSRVAPGSYALRSRHMGTVIARIGAAFDIDWVDPGLLSFFGYVDAVGDDPEVIEALAGAIETEGELQIRWRELLAEPGASDRLELPLRTADGDWRWVRMDVLCRCENSPRRRIWHRGKRTLTW